MRILVVFCHPDRGSFQGSILAALTERLAADGHELTVRDLYAEGFDPALDAEGWRAHRHDQMHLDADLEPHVAALRETEGLVLLYPAWWYGMPAVLKGWFDRVWQPGVAFALEGGAFQLHRLAGLKRFAVITTYGSPRPFIELVVGDPARRQIMRGLALQFARGLKTCWAAIYAVDGKEPERLARERRDAVTRVGRLFS